MSIYCCGACKPRYKRLVDNIFPANPEEGLVKNNMEKLTFYALSSPEKLDRIGDYLARRLSHDIRRRKTGFIFIAMEALDQLLVTCHAHSLNLFVESFLKMTQKLLECYEPDLQVLGTTSFVKFSNIEEDTPSYHRRYDFFVSKFSSMCHSNLMKDDERVRIRTAGLRGLQGVVRKTVSDDLQVNIWEKMHMDKIVPSLLYNLAEERTLPDDSPVEENPAAVAEDCFRDLVCRASYGNIKSVISPMMTHLDLHSLWVPNDFAVKCFTIVMYSVQANYSHLVIQSLMIHLDDHSDSDAVLKSSVLGVISKTAMIAGSSLGPSVLEVFNTLLRHLKVSVSGDYPDHEGERRYQEDIINTIGEFANTLPDYQKIEIMMFILGQMPMDEQLTQSASDILIHIMILKTLKKIATKYQTLALWNAFPEAFLQPLLRLSVVRSSEVRLLVQQILQQLIDRHDNLQHLKQIKVPKDIVTLDLTIETAARQDTLFMKKYGSMFYWHIHENLSMNDNTLENVETIYTTLGCICIEAFGDEIVVDLVRIAFGIQNLAWTKCESPLWLRHALHSLVAAYLNLLSQLTAVPAFCQHVTKVIETRESEAKYLLPETALYCSPKRKLSPNEAIINEEWLFDKNAVSEALKGAGHDTTRLEVPFGSRPSTIGLDLPDHARSISDLNSISIDLDSAQSSPGLGHRTHSLRLSSLSWQGGWDHTDSSQKPPEEQITFESLKKVLTEVDSSAIREEEEKQKEIYDTFLHASFEEIVAKSESKSNVFNNKLNEILDTISNSRENLAELIPLHDKSDDSLAVAFDPKPNQEMEYYDLFVY